jgi:hypothetical protein
MTTEFVLIGVGIDANRILHWFAFKSDTLNDLVQHMNTLTIVYKNVACFTSIDRERIYANGSDRGVQNELMNIVESLIK